MDTALAGGQGCVEADESAPLDGEAEVAKLLAALFVDHVGAPRRGPDPVDGELGDLVHGTHNCALGLVLQHVLERAGRGGQRHVDNGGGALDPDVVYQTEVNNVDAQLGVDDIEQAFLYLAGEFNVLLRTVLWRFGNLVEGRGIQLWAGGSPVVELVSVLLAVSADPCVGSAPAS